MRMLTALRTPLAWALTVLILGACGADGSPAGSRSEGPATSPTTSASPLTSTRSPLNALLAEVYAGSMAAHNAIEREITRCMKDRGFEYEPVPYRDDYPTRPPLGDSFRSAEHWEQDGGSQPRVVGREEENAANAGKQGLDEAGKQAWHEALAGGDDAREPVRGSDGQILAWLPGDGCRAEAERAVLGPDRIERTRLNLMIQQLQIDVFAQIDSDPNVIESLGSFVACMSRAGYDLGDGRDRNEVIDRLADLRAQGQPRLGDDVVACNSESGLADSLDRAEQRAQEAVLEANEGLVVAWREYVARAEQSADDDEAS